MSATRNNDRVGLLIVTDEVEHFIPPNSGRRHVLRLVLELLSFRPVGRRTDLTAGLTFLAGTLRHRATVCLISDFILEDPGDRRFQDAVQRVARSHDLVPVRLADHRGDTLPDVGLVSLLDPESGRRVIVDTADAGLRDSYRRAVADARAEVSALFSRQGLDFIEVETRDDYVVPLLEFFRRRERLSR